MAEMGARAEAARDLEVVVAGLGKWLSSGRVQASSGAFCAWRDVGGDSLAFEYPEITGYALTWLAGREPASQQDVAAGRRAADWLVERLTGGDRSARTGWDDEAVYTFDLGMLSAGLASFGSVVAEESYCQTGREIARQLAGYVEHRGELLPVAPDGPQTKRLGQWSTEGRAHLVKCVQALLLAEEIEAAQLLLRQAIEDQAPDGHFITQPGDEFVMLHPHLYSVEGLWMWGTARDDTEMLERAASATLWAWEHQLPSGGLPRWVSRADSGPEQLDVTSQAVRAALLLDLEPAGLHAGISRVAELVGADGEHGQALIYRAVDVAGHLNAWVTMFAGQALQIAHQGPEAVTWSSLV